MSELTERFTLSPRRTFAIMGGFAIIGTVIGLGVEFDTNDTAAAKANTAQACMEAVTTPTGQHTISKALHRCFVAGVPGGTKIGADKLPEGQPLPFVASYIRAQQHEASHLEPQRIIPWALGGAIGGLVVIGMGLNALEEAEAQKRQQKATPQPDA